MARLLLTVGLLALIGLFFGLMYRSWQRRVGRTSELPALPIQPTGDDVIMQVDHATYLGTVTSAHWLDRVASHGLGGRGPSVVAVTKSGLRFDRIGMAEPVFIPTELFAEIALARGLAGRTFGSDSVVVVSWHLGEELVHTGIRIADAVVRAQLVEELNALPKSSTSMTVAPGGGSDD